MVWTLEHDKMLVREMFVFEPWQFKHGTVERGNCWEAIAENLNKLEYPKFKFVDDRAIRDHYKSLEKRNKKRKNMPEKASGITPEPTEVETVMEDIIDRSEEAEKQQQQMDEEKHKRLAEETQQAEEMWRVP
eukprot:gene11539-12731_t